MSSQDEPRRKRRRRLPRVTARLWSFVGLGIGSVAVLCYIGFLAVSLLINTTAASGLQQGVFALVILGALFAFVHIHLTKGELELRYTTDPWRHPNVDFVDWRTGFILREAGEAPFRSRAQLRKARAEAEAEILDR